MAERHDGRRAGPAERAEPRPAARRDQRSPSAAVLALQRSAGNRATAGLVAPAPQRGSAPGNALQRGVFDALRRGGEMYLRMNDVGAPFARELMRWRVIGLGQPFVKALADTGWNEFMLGRPEIQRALEPVLKDIAKEMAAKGPSGNEWLGGYHDFSKDITGVALNELESMRLTLHGCHRIEIRGRAHVAEEGGVTTVKLYPRMRWVDVADLHPGTETELETGERVDDREFTAAGMDYDISITFGHSYASTYKVSGGSVTHERGWPPIAGAPAAGFRG